MSCVLMKEGYILNLTKNVQPIRLDNLIRITNLLGSLLHMYDDYGNGKAEFYAYNLLFLVFNRIDFERNMHRIPFDLFEDPLLQNALAMVSAIRNDDFYKFFKLIRVEKHYLLSCAASFYINKMR